MWAIYVIAGLLGFGILLLCVPFDLDFEWDSAQQPRSKLRLVWLFGLVRIALEKPPEEAKPARRKEAKRKKGPGMRRFLKLARTEGIIGKAAALVRDIIRQVKVKELKADIRLGLDDPFDAGLAFGAVAAVAPWLNVTPLREVKIQPVFAGDTLLEGEAHALVRLVPVTLLPPLLRFVFSRPAFRLLKALASGR